MIYREHLIQSPTLKEKVLCIWNMKGVLKEKKQLISRLIPKGQSFLILNFGDSISLQEEEKTTTISQKEIVAPIDYKSKFLLQEGEVNLLGISFLGDGLFHFLSNPIEDLGFEVPTKCKKVIEGFRNSYKGDSFTESSMNIEQFLVQSFQSFSPDRIDRFIQLIHETNGTENINSICDQLSLNIRYVQLQFKKRIGISPKRYAKIIRFNHFLDQVLSEDKADWMQIVADLNYHDQSHLIHEFRQLTNLSPSQLFEARDSLYHRYME
jgi:AraC-like DNA-binding protein